MRWRDRRRSSDPPTHPRHVAGSPARVARRRRTFAVRGTSGTPSPWGRSRRHAPGSGSRSRTNRSRSGGQSPVVRERRWVRCPRGSSRGRRHVRARTSRARSTPATCRADAPGRDAPPRPRAPPASGRRIRGSRPRFPRSSRRDDSHPSGTARGSVVRRPLPSSFVAECGCSSAPPGGVSSMSYAYIPYNDYRTTIA